MRISLISLKNDISHIRPSIEFDVSFIRQFMHKPKKFHLLVAYRILICLESSPSKRILYRSQDSL